MEGQEGPNYAFENFQRLQQQPQITFGALQTGHLGDALQLNAQDLNQPQQQQQPGFYAGSIGFQVAGVNGNNWGGPENQPSAFPDHFGSVHEQGQANNVAQDSYQQQQAEQQEDTNSAPSLDQLPLPPPPAKRHRWGAPVVPVGDGMTNASTPPPEDGAGGAGEGGTDGNERKRKKKSRWENSETAIIVAGGSGAIVPTFPKSVTLTGGITVVLPAHLTGDGPHTDPKLKRLHDELTECNRKLANNELDIPPEGQRSPSPEPIYDKNGIRQNTREIRYREKLVDRRNRVIEDLIKEDPNFKPPADYKPRKFHRKIYIPQNEYPGYNFIGLIIGPRGNTQKRMQKETNTKIAIRGKGSVKEGAARDPKYDYGEDEELHVLITGDTQADVDAAYNMLEKLMEPVDEARNEHKRLQLRELAALNGTLKDEVACYLCGETTHRSYECPKQSMEIYQLPSDIKAKVEAQYERDVARMRPELAAGGKMEDEYQSFLKELGGAPPPELMGEDPSKARAMGAGGASTRPKRPGDELPDDCKLYIGNLSPAFNDKMLSSMFEPFGSVIHATVLMDAVTGQSRGYGFVHFTDAAAAKAASDGMNGKMIDGKPLVVRLRSENPAMKVRGPPEHAQDDSKLYVAYLTPNVTEQMLRDAFSAYGPVLEVKLITDRTTGQSKGYAFITMASPGVAQAALKGLNGYKMDGKNIIVKVAGAKTEGAAPTTTMTAQSRPMVPQIIGTPPLRPATPLAPVPGVPPYAMPAPGVPPPYGAPAPYYIAPGSYPSPAPASYPPPIMAPPPAAYPAPYAAPPPGYMPAPAYPAPMPMPGAPPPAGMPTAPPPYVAYYPPPAGSVPPPIPSPYMQPPLQPPLPGQPQPTPPPLPAAQPQAQPPPLPTAPPPAAPPPAPGAPAASVQSEYDRFMSEMSKAFP